jgi:hypothetical protein
VGNGGPMRLRTIRDLVGIFLLVAFCYLLDTVESANAPPFFLLFLVYIGMLLLMAYKVLTDVWLFLKGDYPRMGNDLRESTKYQHQVWYVQLWRHRHYLPVPYQAVHGWLTGTGPFSEWWDCAADAAEVRMEHILEGDELLD